jgi:hypothetical protein
VKDLRDLRDKSKDAIEKTNKNVEDFLKPRPEHDVGRFVVVRVAMVMAIMQEIPIAVLADTTLTAAHRLEGASEPPSVAQGGRGVVVAGCAARAGRESTRSANFWII